MSYHKECKCEVKSRPEIGTFDTVTNEWLPDKPTLVYWLELHPDCPRHPSVGCWICARRSIHLREWHIDPGWALRADRVEPRAAWCPEHIDTTLPFAA